MSTIAVDGLNEETFRRSIETRLRHGKADEAVEKLRALLGPYAGAGRILPERFLTIVADDLSLIGWEHLGDSLARHDRPEQPITAVSIAFGWPGEDVPLPDPEGRLTPLIECGYFTDESFPFSHSSRGDLLDGYSYHGCTWGDEGDAADRILTLKGADDLHGALAALEARLLESEVPDEEEIRAGSLGACLLSALLFQAVSAQVERSGLPRPMCVMAGSCGVYPYFNAPVAGIPEDVLKAAEAAEEDEFAAAQAVPAPRYSSLLVTGIPRARKRAVLVLDESAEETALRNANLRGLGQPGDDAAAIRPQLPPELPAQQNSDTEIIPVAGGPLMSKKPARQGWDFRDMLGPRDSADPELPEAPLPQDGPPAFTPEPVQATPQAGPLPEPGPDPVAESAQLPAAEPVSVPDGALADDRAERTPEPLAQPGFSLLEPSIDERLRALITAPVIPELVLTEQITEIEVEPAPPEPAAPIEVPAHPVWPLGIGWLEDAAAQAAKAEAPAAPAAIQTGLWARFRAWLGRG